MNLPVGRRHQDNGMHHLIFWQTVRISDPRDVHRLHRIVQSQPLS